MTPALAHSLVLACETTRALTIPSPASGCQAKWNWSAVRVPPMSTPPPWTVQVVLARLWPPVAAGLPMSAQFQPFGHVVGCGGPLVVTPTLAKATVLSAEVLCEVTAR